MQNAASLIDLRKLVKVCAHVDAQSGLTCGAYAMACYSMELEHVADYCKRHAYAHGYCSNCGDELTQREKEFTNRLMCDACKHRNDQPHYDDHYAMEDDDDELDDQYGDDEG
jgi:hypothetical protein